MEELAKSQDNAMAIKVWVFMSCAIVEHVQKVIIHGILTLMRWGRISR